MTTLLRTHRFLSACLVLLSCGIASAQTVYSDNFQYANPNGPVPFITTYTQVANNLINGMTPAGVFSITPNLAANLDGLGSTQHPAIAAADQPGGHNFYDHTFGNASGLYMAVNGGATTTVYGVNGIAVTPGTDYNFSVFLNSWTSAGNPTFGRLEVFVNGVSIGFVDAPPVGPYSEWGIPWTERILAFNSGASTSIDLAVVNTIDSADGNDFSIDDISIFAVPEPSVIAFSGLAMAGAVGYGYRRLKTRRIRRRVAVAAA
jgi:hypothetical protein